MTNPVLNQNSPLVKVKNGLGYIIPPWNSFFQQQTQKAPAATTVTISPFTANAHGTLIIQGAATVTLTRGTTNISLAGDQIIPIAIGDTVSWTGSPTLIQFLGD